MGTGAGLDPDWNVSGADVSGTGAEGTELEQRRAEEQAAL